MPPFPEKERGEDSVDIFKLGDKILALLEMVFGFWNNQVSLVFALLPIKIGRASCRERV